jgi:hypothetical protein
MNELDFPSTPCLGPQGANHDRQSDRRGKPHDRRLRNCLPASNARRLCERPGSCKQPPRSKSGYHRLSYSRRHDDPNIELTRHNCANVRDLHQDFLGAVHVDTSPHGHADRSTVLRPRPHLPCLPRARQSAMHWAKQLRWPLAEEIR